MLACLSAGGMQAQNKLLDSPARKLQLAEFAIANLYVVQESKPVVHRIRLSTSP